MDGDGDLDLLMGSPEQDNLYFYRNHGTPQVPQMVLETEEFLNESVHYIYAPSLADFDQDGDYDLFVGDDGAGIYLYRNITPQLWALPVADNHPNTGLHLSLGPNPANPLVVASFELRVASNMSLDIFDICGRKIAELASGFHLPGEYRYVWDATGRAGGMYMLRLRTEVETISEKLVIVK